MRAPQGSSPSGAGLRARVIMFAVSGPLGFEQLIFPRYEDQFLRNSESILELYPQMRIACNILKASRYEDLKVGPPTKHGRPLMAGLDMFREIFYQQDPKLPG